MSGKQYLKNQLAVILINLLGMLALALFLIASGNNIQTVLFILVVWLLVLASCLLFFFFTRKKALDRLLNMAEQLEERYLLPEIMQEPERADEQVFYQIMKMAEKSMLEQIGEVQRERKEYKEYIEQWIHEVKTPRETGETYQKRLLYDFGWGQENGFELLPQLSFRELIRLIEVPQNISSKKRRAGYTSEELLQGEIWRSNLYGAAAVIMQDYTAELITFLSDKICTDYFSNPAIRENFKCFCFDTEKTRAEGRPLGGILTKSYEDVLNGFPQWKRISAKVIRQVY